MRPLLLLFCACATPTGVYAVDLRASLDESGHATSVTRSARWLKDGKRHEVTFGQCRDKEATARLLAELAAAERECQ